MTDDKRAWIAQVSLVTTVCIINNNFFINIVLKIILFNKQKLFFYKLKSFTLTNFHGNNYTPRQKSIRALEIFRVQKLILNATS